LLSKDGHRQPLESGGIGTADKIQDLGVNRHVNQFAALSSQ
jgi:hypothetical protein